MQTQLSVQNIYNLVNHKLQGKGVDGYHLEKKYVDCAKAMKEREAGPIKKGQKDRRHVTKRGNYLQDEQKQHKTVPGVGQYKLQMQWPQKSKMKLHYPDKLTYVDQLMKKQKLKKPAPGSYNVVKTQKEIEAQKKKMKEKKVPVQDRISYLDQVQYQANQFPGVGNYNPRQRVKTEGSKLKTTPEDWRKKHLKNQKKKPEKSPQPASYNPNPSNYHLFQNMQKPKTTNKALMGKVQRFKTAPGGSGLNPAKYNVLQQWKGKDNGKVLRHGVQVLSTKKTAKSVYYH